MKVTGRWLLVALIFVVAIAPFQPASIDAAPTPLGQLRGAGRCSLTSSESFACPFDGRFQGRIEGVARRGAWDLTFGVHETGVGYEVWNQPVAGFRMVLTKTATRPRIVARSSGRATGAVAANADRGFDLSLALTLTDGLAMDVAVDGKFGPATQLHARGGRLPALFDLIDQQGSGAGSLAPRRPGEVAGQRGVLFAGTGRGRGECRLTSSISFVCAWNGRLAGELLSEPRRGAFAIQVYVEELPGRGAPPPLSNPRVLSVEGIRLSLAPTDTRPGFQMRFGRGGTGTAAPNDSKGFDFTLAASLPAGNITINVAFVCRWDAPRLNATGNEVAIESLEIVAEGIS